MATINGITIKSFRTITGVEFPTIREANVWKDGKKIGTYTEDSWGGPGHFSCGLEKALMPVARQFQTGCRNGYSNKLEGDPDTFMVHLLELAEFEKTYKHFVKRNRPVTICIQDYMTNTAWGLMKPINLNKPLPIQIQKAVDNFKGKYHIWQFTSEKDFTITVDEDHPIPEFLDIIGLLF